jgi:hypothetical protein
MRVYDFIHDVIMSILDFCYTIAIRPAAEKEKLGWSDRRKWTLQVVRG